MVVPAAISHYTISNTLIISTLIPPLISVILIKSDKICPNITVFTSSENPTYNIRLQLLTKSSPQALPSCTNKENKRGCAKNTKDNTSEIFQGIYPEPKFLPGGDKYLLIEFEIIKFGKFDKINALKQITS